jgi:hypothetical protein
MLHLHDEPTVGRHAAESITPEAIRWDSARLLNVGGLQRRAVDRELVPRRRDGRADEGLVGVRVDDATDDGARLGGQRQLANSTM